MTLPVSSYEALLVQVRELTHETIQLHRELSSDLRSNDQSTDINHNLTEFQKDPAEAEGKLLYDNIIRKCYGKVESGHRPFVDRSEFVFHPRFSPSFEAIRESFNSGELAARLIAWRNENYSEEESLRHSKESTLEASTKSFPASVGRVGAEGSGKTSYSDSGATVAPPPPPPSSPPPTSAREALTISRPFYEAQDPPLARDKLVSTTDIQSASEIRPWQVCDLRAEIISGEIQDGYRERCQSSRINYRNDRVSQHRKGHDMDTADANSIETLNSGTSSPELYASSDAKCYGEDGSSDEDSKQANSLAYRLSHHHGTWPVKRDGWVDQQSGLPDPQNGSVGNQQNDMASVMSFSSNTSVSSSSAGIRGHRRLGAKVDVVYSLLGMLGSTEGREDMSATLLAMSNSIDSCLVMRQSGCIPLLVQLIHAPGQDHETRERASRALHNVVHARSLGFGSADEKVCRREARVLRLLEQVRDYCQALRASLETVRLPDDFERHPSPVIAALMKLSFDEAHRHAMCQLGGLHAISELIEIDHASHGSDSEDPSCITLRRYAGMALTNLTFGDGKNKALLCSFIAFMKALVSQLRCLSDDLRQVTASVLRNLSWRADSNSKQTLREVGAVTGLMRAAMEGRKESTLKSILSALWNLSAHCSTNKVDICAVEGALAFLVDMLSYEAPSKTLSIVENAGGILRNVSSHIAIREDYRKIIRERGCLQVLLCQLRSPSLTVVSNACGALWNLSARCPHDQRLLWDLGAVPMLRSLVHSKHKMISMGSSAALKNLLSARPAGSNLVHLDSTARGLGLPTLPTLVARRQRALEQEIDQNLAETCDNIEPSSSPTNKDDKFSFKLDSRCADAGARSRNYQANLHQSLASGSKHGLVPRSESRESVLSVTSTHSDTIFERVNRHVTNGLTPAELQIKQQSSSLHSAVGLNGGYSGTPTKTNDAEKRYALRYKNSIPERSRNPDFGINDSEYSKCIASTMSWATGPDQECACSQILMHSSVEENETPTVPKKLARGELDFTKRSDNGAVRISLLKSPIENVTFNKSLAGSGILSDRTFEKQTQSVVPRRGPKSGPLELYETDHDEPTNYSLRYAERSSDDDEKHSGRYFSTMKQPFRDSSDAESSDFQGNRYTSQKINAGRTDTESREKKLDSSPLSLNNTSTNNAYVGINSYHSEVAGSGESTTETESADTVIMRLNSLTLSDQPKISNDSGSTKLLSGHSEARGVENFSHVTTSDDDDDEDLLAACIHIGMQNNRHRQSFRRKSLEKASPAESKLARYQTRTALDQVQVNEYIKQSDRTLDSSRFSPKSTDAPANENEEETNRCTSDEDNLVVTKVEEKTNVEYGRVEESSGHCQKDESGSDRVIETVVKTNVECNKSAEHESRADCVDDNPANDDILNDVAAQSDSSSNRETRDSESIESFDSVERSEQALLQLCIKSGVSKSDTIPMGSNSILPNDEITKDTSPENENGVVENEGRAIEDRRDSDVSEETKSSRSRGSEGRKVEDEYRRQRDPDAMIASLDRLTATLVQQTEAMRERESSAMKQSVLSDTWAEDSPNDVSYPSISVSAPLISSFKSDIDEEQPAAETLMTLKEDERMESSLMSSGIIEREAIRLAEVVSAEGSRQSLSHETKSLTSSDITTVQPHATIENSGSRSLTYAGNGQESRNGRKKSLPIGVVAKRALAHDTNHAGSLESLLNDCSLGTNSQLENMMPPSLMDEILDNGDMENSMLSVASITSEIADPKDQDSNSLTASDTIFDLVQPVANVLSMTCMRYAAMHNSVNDSTSECLENINPPSLLNEISDMDDSTIDANTDTMCSDTLCIDVDLKTEEVPRLTIAEKIDEYENDTDEAGTPITTESCCSSSAESSPKKRSHRSHLTPKQKRQLAKERFKTYTIAAELVKKEEDERRKHVQEETEICKISRGKCSPFSKMTPKQRRQGDPSRFQTQVLTNAFSEFADELKNLTQQNEAADHARQEHIESVLAQTTTITNANLCGGKTFRKRRSDQRESFNRYRTRTFNVDDEEDGDEETRNPEAFDTNNGLESGEERTTDTGSESVHTMLEQNANIVLHSLNETSKASEVNNEDMMLDCETLSLVSNDSESECNYRSRIACRLGKKLMTNNLQTASQGMTLPRRELSDVDVKLEAREDSESEEDNSNNAEEQPREVRKPRIVKPGTMSRDPSADSQSTGNSEPGSPKAIRGRRKALYSIPNTRRVTPQSSPLKQAGNNLVSGIPSIGRSNTSPVVRTTRAMTLRQNTNVFANNSGKEPGKSSVPQKIPQTPSAEKRPKNAALAKRSSIPQRGSSYNTSAKSVKRHSTPPGCANVSSKERKVEAPVIKPLERQGTFTKDEPEVENAPTIGLSTISTKSKIAKPTKGSPVRTNPTVAGKSKILPRPGEYGQPARLTKCSSADKIQPRASLSLIPAKRAETVVESRCQSDQAQNQVTEAGKPLRRLTSLVQRSNSNSSIITTQNASVASRKLPKEATSKIASLWKKVEESKNKQKLEKADTRQWITATSVDSNDSREAPVSSKPPMLRLFRSSTFEGVPQDFDATARTHEALEKNLGIPPNAPQYRNSCDLTGMSQADAPCRIPVKLSEKKYSAKETPIGYGTIVLRKQRSSDSSPATSGENGTNRLSRLGSFIRVETESESSSQVREGAARTPISAIVPPFNYSPPQEATKAGDLQEDSGHMYEFQAKIVTSSAKVTTV